MYKHAHIYLRVLNIRLAIYSAGLDAVENKEFLINFGNQTPAARLVTQSLSWRATPSYRLTSGPIRTIMFLNALCTFNCTVAYHKETSRHLIKHHENRKTQLQVLIVVVTTTIIIIIIIITKSVHRQVHSLYQVALGGLVVSVQSRPKSMDF